MIVRAAVNVEGRIYKGRRHGDAIHAAVEAGEKTPITQKMQGFVTNSRLFLSRVEARGHATRCGQLKFNIEKANKPLISEELW